MGESTAIAWCDHTFNPWWGCTKIAGPNGTGSACDNCYAAAFAKRTGYDVWGKDGARRFFGEKHWDEPLKWEKQAAAGVPGPNTGRADHLVFCASMADVFEARDDLDDARLLLWDLIARTPHLTWLLLTKRPEQVLRRVPTEWASASWPRNVWIGTTVEDQARAELRVPRLDGIPAPVKFLSIEPLLGPVDLRPWLRRINDEARAASPFEWDTSNRIGWVIVGGESGAHHRGLDLDAARAIRDECGHWNVPFFFKQVGGRTPTTGGDQLDGERIKEFPRPLYEGA